LPRRDTWVSRRGHGRFRVGWLRGDLIAFARAMADYLATPLGETVVRTPAATQDDPALSANRAQFVRARYQAARVMIDRAADRGDVRPETDSQIALELLAAPLHFRVLLTRQPIDDSFIEHVVDTLLRGL
jgi:hypothetical protein